MYVSLVIHRPKPGQAAGLIERMHRFRDAAEDAPGLQRIHTLQDRESGVLVGLAIWDCEEAYLAARSAMRAAIAEVDFTIFEDAGPATFRLVEV